MYCMHCNYFENKGRNCGGNHEAILEIDVLPVLLPVIAQNPPSDQSSRLVTCKRCGDLLKIAEIPWTHFIALLKRFYSYINQLMSEPKVRVTITRHLSSLTRLYLIADKIPTNVPLTCIKKCAEACTPYTEYRVTTCHLNFATHIPV